MTQPPRILYYSTQFPNRLAPTMGVFSLERVRALRATGCAVTVVNPRLANPPLSLLRRPPAFARALTAELGLPTRWSQDGVEIYSPPYFCLPKPWVGWKMSAIQYAQARRAALQAAAQARPQVILASWLPDGLAALNLGRRLGVPVFCIADGTDLNQWPCVYPYWPAARDRLNREIAGLIYVSAALREAGTQHGLRPARSAVIHNAVDTRVFCPAEKPASETLRSGPFRLLAVGRMTPVKGYPVLLEAFDRFLQESPRPATLTLAGDGPQRPELEQRAAALGLAEAVRFIGAVPPGSMPACYQSADLLCLPSYSEGLPCVAVEAMSCGLPVVGSSVGGVPELVGEQCGILVAPGDPAVLCQALLSAAARPWDAAAIRQVVLDGYSWEKWTAQIFELFSSQMPEFKGNLWPA